MTTAIETAYNTRLVLNEYTINLYTVIDDVVPDTPTKLSYTNTAMNLLLILISATVIPFKSGLEMLIIMKKKSVLP